MNIKNKKGYVLPIAITFTVILITASIGLYASVRYFVVETRIKEVEYIRGYYAALAGLRYAAILLRDPNNYCSFTNYVHTVSGNELGGTNFFTEINVAPQKLTITIEEWHTGVGWAQGEYDIEATYTY